MQTNESRWRVGNSIASRLRLGQALSPDGDATGDLLRAASELLYWFGALAVVTYAAAVLLLSLGALPDSSLVDTAGAARHQTSTVDLGTPTKAGDAGTSVAVSQPSAIEPVPALPLARDPATGVTAGSGKAFRDAAGDGKPCPLCPELVVVPHGRFKMGSPASEAWRLDWQRDREVPQLDIAIAKPFAVGRFAVTFEEWDACAADHECVEKPLDSGWGRGNRPVINITWDEAVSYVAWLSRKTGRSYRLLSEAEREYVSRAGTTSPFWFGSAPSPRQANYLQQSADSVSPPPPSNEKTLPVDSFAPNAWGLYNVHGNVYDWTADCWNETLAGHRDDGAAMPTGECSQRVLKGGSWFHPAMLMRSAARTHVSAGFRTASIGLRVARSIEPTAVPGSLRPATVP